MKQLLSGFEPISLAETNQNAKLMTRVDSKYMVPWESFVDWASTLDTSHRILEIDGRRLFTYDTRYFDTSDLDLFRHHLQNRRRRFKVRTRQYVESDLTFLEIKLRGRRGETIKRRIPYDSDFLNEIRGEGHDFLDECVHDEYGFGLDYSLAPVIQTLYRRATFVARDGTDRITCDVNLNFVRGGESRALMHPAYVLVEIKSESGRGPYDRALWHRGIRPGKGSKFGIGVCMTMTPERSNIYAREIRTFYRDVRNNRKLVHPFKDVSLLDESTAALVTGQASQAV